MGSFKVLLGFAEVDAGEVMTIGMTMLFELVGSGFWS